MCGIVGVAGRLLDRELVPRMLGIIRHRGPDSQGFFLSDGIHLGHCRLSINDLSERGNQPFVSEDHTVAVTVNGEIYNYQDIKNSLVARGYSFGSNSDCEVVLHAYMEWGLDFIPSLNGMFAIAIWDGRKKSLFLVRDRIGIKPLYYAKAGKYFLFASEIKALAICNETDLSLDLQSFGEYLVFENYFANRTLNKHIKLVEPGQIVEIKSPLLSVETNYFWQPVLSRVDGRGDRDTYEHYQDIIESSVNRHLLSDVPVGCYLSSGIDSSSVTYYASRKLNGNVKTYTGYFGIDGFYDEATSARRVAHQFGCANERVDICPGDFVDHIENVIYHLDEPRVGMGSFSQYMVARKAAQEVKVILTGHGGDELFAGYPVFKAVYGRKNILRLLTSSSLREMMMFVYFSLFSLMRGELRYFLPNIYAINFLKIILQKDFYNELVRNTNILEEPERLRKASATEYEQLFLTYLRFYLPALFVVEDKISMAFSLESRTPLCDNEMLDFALSLPLSDKLKNYELKHIPRTAMKGKLPNFLYSLPKRGFPTPLVLWFKKDLRDFIRHYVMDNIDYLDMFNKKQVEKMIADYQNTFFQTPYDEIRAHRLWILMNLIIYFRHQKHKYRTYRTR